MARVDGLVAHQPESAGFAAMYRKAGLPLDLLPAVPHRIACCSARSDWTIRSRYGRPVTSPHRAACLTACASDQCTANSTSFLFFCAVSRPRRRVTEARCSPPPDAACDPGRRTYDGLDVIAPASRLDPLRAHRFRRRPYDARTPAVPLHRPSRLTRGQAHRSIWRRSRRSSARPRPSGRAFNARIRPLARAQ